MNSSLDQMENWTFDDKAQYFYFCQNESIEGYELDQKYMRKVIDRVKNENSNAIIVSDMSSSIGSRDLTKENL